MEIDGKILYAGALALFAIAMAFVLSTQYLADADYGMLLKSGTDAGTAKTLSLLLFVLLPLAVYLIAAYALKADAFHSFVAALLFAVAGLNVESLYSLAPLIGMAMGKQYELAAIVKSAGLLAALGALSLIRYEKEKITAALAVVGIVLMAFAPGLGLILVAIAAAKGISLLEDEKQKNNAIAVAVAGFCFQGFYSGDAGIALAVALFAALVAYIVAALHAVKSEEIAAVLLIFVAAGILGGMSTAKSGIAKSLGADELGAYAAAKNVQGSFGVLDYPNAFEYYAGKKAVLLNASDMLRKGKPDAEFVLFSTRSLDAALGDMPLEFAYAESYKSGNTETAVFLNRKYALYMGVSNGDLAVQNGVFQNLDNAEQGAIPFTKLKKLFNLSYSDPQNRIIDIVDLEESRIYEVLFPSTVAFDRNGTRIIGVG